MAAKKGRRKKIASMAVTKKRVRESFGEIKKTSRQLQAQIIRLRKVLDDGTYFSFNDD